MNYFKTAVAAMMMSSSVAANPFAFATASATEAKKLKSELTLLGGAKSRRVP